MNTTTYERAKAYECVSRKVKDFFEGKQKMYSDVKQTLEYLFPELRESEDERIRKELIAHCRNTRCVTEEGAEGIAKWIAWLEKQGEPNWVNHKVDLSYCSEEYRKAYYDGWNNCNKQHSQLKDEEHSKEKQQWIDCAVNYLLSETYGYIVDSYGDKELDRERLAYNFKKAMEEQL